MTPDTSIAAESVAKSAVRSCVKRELVATLAALEIARQALESVTPAQIDMRGVRLYHTALAAINALLEKRVDA